MRTYLCLIIISLGLNFSCSNLKNSEKILSNTPEWSKNAVWYQIFVERFRNGDTTNDPTAEDIIGAYPDFVPDGWHITPWTQDWFKRDDYIQNVKKEDADKNNGFTGFNQQSQLRRYGGDLQGVLDELDYLQDLGITAIYFNPLNDSPSLHKYDARYWRHIDRNFGPTPEKDIEIIKTENPLDSNTWKWTGADKMFVDVIKACHDRGIKVILDYSWNHTGVTFWAWQDVLKNQENSKYADWYWIKKFDDKTTPENEFEYSGWLGVASLPEIKETVQQDHSKGIRAFEGNIKNEQVKELIFNITKRWLDPNNDGNPEDGVDGFRLDVAAEIPLGFWREYHNLVKSINPEAYLLGEIWYEQFPDKLLNPKPFLQGDIFDAVMNYRWYRTARRFFSGSEGGYKVSEFANELSTLLNQFDDDTNQAMMNLTASHDTPRVLTSLYNKTKYKFEATPEANPDYKINKPDAETYQTLKLLLAHQFTYVGAPHIWAGDEMGMWGGDDPINRKPLMWKDYKFEDETHHPLNLDRPKDEVKFNDELFDFYKKLVSIRKSNSILSNGKIDFIITDDKNQILAYSRFNENNEVIAVFNLSDEVKEISIPTKFNSESYKDVLFNMNLTKGNSKIILKLKPRSSVILVK